MSENININPFAGLFPTLNHAVKYASPRNEEINSFVGEIFGLVLESNVPCENKPLVHIDTDSLETAIFERLMLAEPDSQLITDVNTTNNIDSHIIQTEAINYLFESYRRLENYRPTNELLEYVNRARNIIIQNAAVVLQESELFPNQQIHQQFAQLFLSYTIVEKELSSFVSLLVEKLIQENSESVIFPSFAPILDILHKEIANSTLLTIRRYWFDLLFVFSSTKELAETIIRHSTPKEKGGRAYANTLLGALLSLSCLPKTLDAPFEFFDKSSQQARVAVENNIWTALDTLSEFLQTIFHSLLKCKSTTEVRHLTLQWIANCLYANSNRGKLWNTHNDLNFGFIDCVSDGFMINLGSILLKLCQPFCQLELDNVRIPKIDPTYCADEAKNDEESKSRGLHMKGMILETCFIPVPEGEARPVAKSYNFMTECFFLTHRALSLGFKVVLDKFLKTRQDLAMIQRGYTDAQAGGSPEVLETITNRMEIEMNKSLSFRASLLVPDMLANLAKFHATTTFWLMQVNLSKVENELQNDFIPKVYQPITFPLPDQVPSTLRCIPEFLIENLVAFLCFLNRSNANTLEEQGSTFLNPVLTTLIALMESQSRLYNPHLRARLAEGLEALLPIDEANVSTSYNLGTFHRQQLFQIHPHRQQVVTSLLQVFVSIEMTGQSVQFEQKFNYRRPMYIIMDYLWKIEELRNSFVSLAEQAEANMEAVQPPLFLRFINLLINDATFLLDEALSHMAQLKEMIQARDTGEWGKLPIHEREQQAGYLRHIGMIASFNNSLGQDTIRTLKNLTTYIKSIFCHPTMVDRIASMLNYLLLQLVGPKSKTLKVRDQKAYHFDPANLVLNICEIYINLCTNNAFMLAVSQDGRSYSPELFKLADKVLVRIGGAGLLGDLCEFAEKVEQVAALKKEEDQILMEAPDEFFDPIMSTVMTDPVVLPSSKMTVDRQTIARHLLSDQTDPFNRSPLSMDMIVPDNKLRDRINEWLTQQKQDRATSNQK